MGAYIHILSASQSSRLTVIVIVVVGGGPTGVELVSIAQANNRSPFMLISVEERRASRLHRRRPQKLVSR